MSGITTTIGALPSYIATATVPDLTTVFSPPAFCEGRWLAAETSTIAWSTYSRDGYKPPVDPLYYSCLPSSLKGPHYSPGVCTDGQTIAGITKYDTPGSRTMWQAQCCDSGMTIGTQTIQNSPVPMCMSAFSTPLPVHALITTTYANGDVASPYYDYVVNDKTTISNIITMTKGTAVADPLYVAWESKDLSLFPVAYATSLAQKIGVTFTPTSTPTSRLGSSSSSSLPTSTSGSGSPASSTAAAASSGLSSTAKIGLGVGLAVGVLLILALIGMLFVLRRLKRRQHEGPPGYDENHPAMASQDQGLGNRKWYHRGEAGTNGSGNVNAVEELDSFPVHVAPGPPVELEGSHTYRGFK